MSESSLSSDDAPTDATLELNLRNAVRQVYMNGDLENLTVRRVRRFVEEELNLEDGFFRDDPVWNKKSKGVIQSEVDAHPNTSSQQAPSSPPIQKRSRPPPSTKSQDHENSAHGTKRASMENDGPKKRRKKNTSDGQGSRNNKVGSHSKKLIIDVKQQSPSSSVSPPPIEEEAEAPSGLNVIDKNTEATGEHSESELSELLDEEPKSKGRGRKSGAAKPKVKKTEGSKAKRSLEHPMDPGAEEMKKLQGWLVKCGIRKVWGRELAPYSTPKARIRHLRDMLAEAGMTGRFSLEKANQIKEERELRADLEAVQEGNKHWGKPESEEEVGHTGRAKRKLARSLEGLDFLNDDDGEETD